MSEITAAKNTLPKKKIVQFSVIAILLIIIIVSRAAGPKDHAIALPPWDGEIDRLLVRGPGIDVALYRTESGWKIGENRYPADEGEVLRMADALKGLKIDQLVTTREEFERYGLTDPEAIVAEAYSSSGLLRSVRIGREAERGSGSYISVSGMPGIYLARGSLGFTFSRSGDDLRNRQILSLAAASLIAVRVEGPGGTYSFIREAAGAAGGGAAGGGAAGAGEQWAIPELKNAGFETDQAKANQFLSQLSRITASSFPEQSALDGRNPDWRFTLQDQRKTYTLEVYAPFPAGEVLPGGDISGEDMPGGPSGEVSGESPGDWPALSSENPFPFALSSYKADQILKGREWFIPEAGEP